MLPLGIAKSSKPNWFNPDDARGVHAEQDTGAGLSVVAELTKGRFIQSVWKLCLKKAGCRKMMAFLAFISGAL